MGLEDMKTDKDFIKASAKMTIDIQLLQKFIQNNDLIIKANPDSFRMHNLFSMKIDKILEELILTSFKSFETVLLLLFTSSSSKDKKIFLEEKEKYIKEMIDFFKIGAKQ